MFKKIILTLSLFVASLTAFSQNVFTETYRSTEVYVYDNIFDTTYNTVKGKYSINFWNREDSSFISIKQLISDPLNFSYELLVKKSMTKLIDPDNGNKIMTFDALDLKTCKRIVFGIVYDKATNLLQIGIAETQRLFVFLIDQHYTNDLKTRL